MNDFQGYSNIVNRGADLVVMGKSGYTHSMRTFRFMFDDNGVLYMEDVVNSEKPIKVKDAPLIENQENLDKVEELSIRYLEEEPEDYFGNAIVFNIWLKEMFEEKNEKNR